MKWEVGMHQGKVRANLNEDFLNSVPIRWPSARNSRRGRECCRIKASEFIRAHHINGGYDHDISCTSSNEVEFILIRGRSLSFSMGSWLSTISVWKITHICNRNSASTLKRWWLSLFSTRFQWSNWFCNTSLTSNRPATKICAILTFSAHANWRCWQHSTTFSRI